jgi:FkbM family methyltransferase
MNNLKKLGWYPKNIIDIGAYKGSWYIQTKNMFPHANFTLIEPNRHNELSSLKVPIFYEILSSEIKNVNWYSNFTTGDSIYKEKTVHYLNVNPQQRTTTTLDKLFPEEKFDFIKIDCQGAELDILKGGETICKHAEVLLLECPFAGQYNDGSPCFFEYIKYLDSIGFSPFDITELHKAGGILIQVDILFIKKTSNLWLNIQQSIR